MPVLGGGGVLYVAAGGGGPASFLGNAENGGASSTTNTVTISAIDSTTGYVVVSVALGGAGSDDGAITAPGAVTIGGVTAEKLASAAWPNGRTEVSFWGADVASGNGGVVSATTPAAVFRTGSGAWLFPPGMAAVSSGSSYAAAGGTAHSVTTGALAGDSILSVIYVANTFTTTWTGATENFDAQMTPDGIYHSGALTESATASQVVTATQTGQFAGALLLSMWAR